MSNPAVDAIQRLREQNQAEIDDAQSSLDRARADYEHRQAEYDALVAADKDYARAIDALVNGLVVNSDGLVSVDPESVVVPPAEPIPDDEEWRQPPPEAFPTSGPLFSRRKKGE